MQGIYLYIKYFQNYQGSCHFKYHLGCDTLYIPKVFMKYMYKFRNCLHDNLYELLIFK